MANAENNNFNFLRFAAALLVLVSHHFALAGLPEPIVPLVGGSLGHLAVNVFFVISGFLLARSLLRSPDPSYFLAARLLRIAPKLVVASFATSAFMLFYFSNYGHLWEHIVYAAHNSVSFLADADYFIDGVLEGRPNESLNGSLWTLQYEFFMYLVLLALFLCSGRFRAVALVAAFCIFAAIGLAPADADIDVITFDLAAPHLSRLGQHFMAGAIVGLFWNTLARSGMLLGLGAAALIAVGLFTGLLPAVYFGFTVLIVLAGTGNQLGAFSRLGDGSYGIYLFAFPVQQICLLLVAGFWTSMLAASVVTILLGYAAWHGFENRMLGKKSDLAAYFKSRSVSVRAWPLRRG